MPYAEGSLTRPPLSPGVARRPPPEGGRPPSAPVLGGEEAVTEPPGKTCPTEHHPQLVPTPLKAFDEGTDHPEFRGIDRVVGEACPIVGVHVHLAGG